MDEIIIESINKNNKTAIVKDPSGNVFKSKKQMYSEWGIPYHIAIYRENLGWDTEKILTTPIKEQLLIKDPSGKVFKSKKQMYSEWGIPYGIAKGRENLGWDIERILTTPIKSRAKSCNIIDSKSEKPKEVSTTPIKEQLLIKDPSGKVFKSKKQMYSEWGIPYHVAINRENLGWDIEMILTTPIKDRAVQIEDHLGNKFNSITDMLKKYDISRGVYQSKLKIGYTKEEILTESYKVSDHLGNKYASINVMCKKYGISVAKYLQKINEGYSIEEVLTKSYRVLDPFGNVYETKSEMCRKYGIKISSYDERIKRGLSIIQSLEISLIIHSNMVNVNKTKYNLTVVKRIKLGKDVFECYIDNGDGTSTFKIMSYDMIDQYCLEQYKKLHNIE